MRRAAERSQSPRDDDLVLLDLFRSSHYPCLRHVQERLIRLFEKKRLLDPEAATVVARPLKTI